MMIENGGIIIGITEKTVGASQGGLVHIVISDVSGRAQSPEPGPARPSKARPEAGLGSGFQ
jgi:hypothetical protein